MRISVRRIVRAAIARWKAVQLTRAALGKYIIAAASLLHVVWAAMLLASADAAGSTPLHYLNVICGGRYRTAVVLVLVAVLAMILPFIDHPVSNGTIGALLIPQLAVLFVSAESAIRAIALAQYADGVPRPWAFIAADQTPMILLSALYVVVVLEVAWGLAHRRKMAEATVVLTAPVEPKEP